MLLRLRHMLFLLAGDKIFNSQSLWYFNFKSVVIYLLFYNYYSS